MILYAIIPLRLWSWFISLLKLLNTEYRNVSLNCVVKEQKELQIEYVELEIILWSY